MTLSEKMKKMIGVIEANDKELRKDNDLNKHYLAPDISDKIMKKLIKYYDNHLDINGVIAFYDETLLGTAKSGIIFTNDGLYHKFLGKPIYIRYSNITNYHVEDGNVTLQITDSNLHDYTLFSVLDGNALGKILGQLIVIDKEYGQTSSKTSGNIKKVDIPEDMKKKCHSIIHGASLACGGVGTGLAQIPASDTVVIVPIQIGMIVSLGAVFELDITESAAKSILASAGASITGRTISQFLVGWIPVIGNAINTVTAAGITEAIGWLAVANFYERWLDDKNKGRLDGMRDGYSAASGEYERKLRKQAEDFLNQIKDVQREKDEYEKLLLEYEEYIKELEKRCAALELINEMQNLYSNLKKLKAA